jgi:hypothetical protein
MILVFPISLAFTIFFFWLLIATSAPAADGHTIIHNEAKGVDTGETAVDGDRAMDFDDFIFDRDVLVGKEVILSGYLTYGGAGLAKLRPGMESDEKNSVVVEYLPRDLRREMFKRCKSPCQVDIRARVARGGNLMPIDMDIYGVSSNVPKGFFW